MSQTKMVYIENIHPADSETKIYDLVLPAGETLSFVGGQYIILHTGIPLEGGKTVKRAYSILSGDACQNRFQLAVKRLEGGPGSNFMHQAKVGDVLSFSGPWGKFFLEESVLPLQCLVAATDTGITAALGLVKSERFKIHLSGCRLIWLVESRDYFLREGFLRRTLPKELGKWSIEPVPALGDPGRLLAAQEKVKKIWREAPAQEIFLSGDGALIYPWIDDFKSWGVMEENLRFECFFNNPVRKAPSAQAGVL